MAASRLSEQDREHVLANLRASSRWLSLLSTRLSEAGEREAARLTGAARLNIDAVCRCLSGDRQQGLPRRPSPAGPAERPAGRAGTE